MRITYLPVAKREHDRKLARIALRPFTTHSLIDFLDDISHMENQIRERPVHRQVSGAPIGYFRVGPSPIYTYSLIYRMHEGDACVIAVVAPERRPLYWRRRKF